MDKDGWTMVKTRKPFKQKTIKHEGYTEVKMKKLNIVKELPTIPAIKENQAIETTSKIGPIRKTDDPKMIRSQIAFNYKKLHVMAREEIICHFSKFGKVKAVNLYELQGFGFIQYSMPEEADQAVKELDGKLWNGRANLISFESKKNSTNAVNTSYFVNFRDTKSRLYVTNFDSKAVSRDDLFALFGTYGEVTGIRIYPCFAFVQFSNEKDAEKAVERLDEKFWKGYKLHVKQCYK